MNDKKVVQVGLYNGERRKLIQDRGRMGERKSDSVTKIKMKKGRKKERKMGRLNMYTGGGC